MDILLDTLKLVRAKGRAAEVNADAALIEAQADPEFARLYSARARLAQAAAKDEGRRKEYAETEKKLFLRARELGLRIAPEYSCARCGDTGYLAGNTLCPCVKALVNRRVRELCGVGGDSAVSLNDVKEIKDEKQKKFLSDVYAMLQAYMERYEETDVRVLLFAGSTGTGKTRAAATLMYALAERGENILFLTAYKLNSFFVKAHLMPLAEKEDLLSELINTDVLVLDDLGTETSFKAFNDYFLLLLSERSKARKLTVLTTNLTQKAVETRYGIRIFSRLFDKTAARCIQFAGKDLRLA